MRKGELFWLLLIGFFLIVGTTGQRAKAFTLNHQAKETITWQR